MPLPPISSTGQFAVLQLRTSLPEPGQKGPLLPESTSTHSLVRISLPSPHVLLQELQLLQLSQLKSEKMLNLGAQL